MFQVVIEVGGGPLLQGGGCVLLVRCRMIVMLCEGWMLVLKGML